MADILEKKNKQEIDQSPEESSLQEDIVLSDDITIHVIPERFRSSHIKVGQAQKTGMTIIVSGIVFLIIISGLFYYFFFNNKNNNSIQSSVSSSTPAIEPVKTENPVIEPQTQPATTTVATTSIILSSEISTSTSSATTTATTTEEIINKPVNISAGIDSDSDGLTDEEEKIFGSSPSALDSDKDGHNDFSEVLNGYNPAGSGVLSANSNLTIYNNKTYNYNLLYPLTWKDAVSGDDDSIMFKAVDGGFIQVISQKNSEQQQSISDWYKQQFNVSAIDQNNLINNDNWQGVINSDSLTVYLMDSKKKYIFVITYNPSVSNLLNYPNLFKAMVKSFNKL